MTCILIHLLLFSGIMIVIGHLGIFLKWLDNVLSRYAWYNFIKSSLVIFFLFIDNIFNKFGWYRKLKLILRSAVNYIKYIHKLHKNYLDKLKKSPWFIYLNNVFNSICDSLNKEFVKGMYNIFLFLGLSVFIISVLMQVQVNYYILELSSILFYDTWYSDVWYRESYSIESVYIIDLSDKVFYIFYYAVVYAVIYCLWINKYMWRSWDVNNYNNINIILFDNSHSWIKKKKVLNFYLNFILDFNISKVIISYILYGVKDFLNYIINIESGFLNYLILKEKYSFLLVKRKFKYNEKDNISIKFFGFKFIKPKNFIDIEKIIKVINIKELLMRWLIIFKWIRNNMLFKKVIKRGKYILYFSVLKNKNNWNHSLILNDYSRYNMSDLMVFSIHHRNNFLELIWTLITLNAILFTFVCTYSLLYELDSLGMSSYFVKTTGSQWFWKGEIEFGNVIISKMVKWQWDSIKTYLISVNMDLYLELVKLRDNFVDLDLILYKKSIFSNEFVKNYNKGWFYISDYGWNLYLVDNLLYVKNIIIYNYKELSHEILFNGKRNYEMHSINVKELSYGWRRMGTLDYWLTVPLNMSVRYIVTSDDVIHSLYLSRMGCKMDGVPGRLNGMSITACVSGSDFGQCTELCGLNHAFMPIMIEVDNIENIIDNGILLNGYYF